MSDGTVQIWAGAVLVSPAAGVATADECCCAECPCPGAQPDCTVVTAGVCDIPAIQVWCDSPTGARAWTVYADERATWGRCRWEWGDDEGWVQLLVGPDWAEVNIYAILGTTDLVYRNTDCFEDIACVAGDWTGTVVCTATGLPPGHSCVPMTATVEFG